MKSNKAPAASQLTTNMLENLPEDTLNFVSETIQIFWQQGTDFTSLHVMTLGKGDPQDLNNYRGICLKETCTKIISSIVSHQLLLHLKTFGFKTQFGMTGCQEVQHTLKKALLLQRQHRIPTYARKWLWQHQLCIMHPPTYPQHLTA